MSWILRFLRTMLLLINTFTDKPVKECYVCHQGYTATLGKSPMTFIKRLDKKLELEYDQNSFWLRGRDDDFATVDLIKQSSCENQTVPVIVLFMHPSQGLALDAEAGHYMPEKRIGTWEEYDEKLDYYAKHLSDIPSLIVMELSLLMHTFNSKTEYHNTPYLLAFTKRVERVVNLFPYSWVYVDSGNAMYLQWTVNLDHVISVLKQMPATIRGFSINVGSFVNSTYNQLLAEEIHCQTGLHYLVDTSRNGGEFSTRSLDDINECTYDPPQIGKGESPHWEAGAVVQTLAGQVGLNTMVQETPVSTDTDTTESEYLNYDEYQIGGKRRKKRWELDATNTGNEPVYYSDDSAGAGGGANLPTGGGWAFYYYYDGAYYDGYDADTDALAKACVSNEGETGLDGYAWIKTPGEADGRIFPSGTYHPCLLNHYVECTDTCPMYVPKLNGEFQRTESCHCKYG